MEDEYDNNGLKIISLISDAKIRIDALNKIKDLYNKRFDLKVSINLLKCPECVISDNPNSKQLHYYINADKNIMRDLHIEDSIIPDNTEIFVNPDPIFNKELKKFIISNLEHELSELELEIKTKEAELNIN